MPKTPAAAQFAALGIAEEDYTDAMRTAVTQRWAGLPVEKKIGDLRAELAAIETPTITLDDVPRGTGDPAVVEAAAAEELKRLRRNAAVNTWRAKTKLQAAIDARDVKFAALRAKRRTTSPRPGTETGDPAPLAAVS